MEKRIFPFTGTDDPDVILGTAFGEDVAEGTAILSQDFSDVAQTLELSKQDLKEAQDIMGEISVVPETLALA